MLSRRLLYTLVKKNNTRSFMFSRNIKSNLINSIILSNNCFPNFKQNLEKININYEKKILRNNKLDSKKFFKENIIKELESFSKENMLEKRFICNKIHNIDHSAFYNEYNYYKLPLVEYDLFNAYLIIWGKASKTPVHYHAANGCCILKLDGLWLENIFDKYGNNIKSTIFKSNSISYIDNTIGSHQITYLNSYPGISINIYSPSKELS